MDSSADETCILVLQRDVFIQFQSIQLATKLDANAQMEMFFQLYHCVMATHFKPEALHNSGLKKVNSHLPKQDHVTHGKLADLRWTKNNVNHMAKDGCSSVMKQITTPLYNKPNNLPIDSNTPHLKNENLSVSHLQFDETWLNTSDTSDSCEESDALNNQQIPGGTETGDLDTNTSVNIGCTETSYDSESNNKSNVMKQQVADSTATLTSMQVRKGRRKSAPKRAAPVDDDDLLDTQLLIKQECLSDDSYHIQDMDRVTSEDNNTIPNSTETSDSFLLQRYKKDSSFELPTMVHGTNYRPMTSSSSKTLYLRSPVNKNNHDMSKNCRNNSDSVETEKQCSVKTSGGTDVKREFVQPTDKLSDDGSPEMDDGDKHSNSGDLSDDHTPRTGPLKCEFCSFTSHRRYNLNRHRRIHTGNMFQCEKCDRKFNEPGKLKTHTCRARVVKSANKVMYSCDICSASEMKSIDSLRQHVLSEHNIEDTFVCVSCSSQVIFHDPQKFKNHLETLHTVQNRSQSKSTCDECGREFKYLRSLQKHKEICVLSMYKTSSVVKVLDYVAL